MGRACTEVAFSVEIGEEKQQVGSPSATTSCVRSVCPHERGYISYKRL